MSSIVINHEWIKAEVVQIGCPVTELLALARQNDPFYVGTPSSLTQARWFAKIWEKGCFPKGVHLRRFHYWCFSKSELMPENDKPYENPERCWQYLCLASKAARYLGLVPIADIADHKNPAPHVRFEPQSGANARFEIDTPDFSDPYIYINGGRDSVRDGVHPGGVSKCPPDGLSLTHSVTSPVRHVTGLQMRPGGFRW